MPYTEDEEKQYKELLGRVGGGGGGTTSTSEEASPGSIGSAPGDTLRGVAQAGLNVVEGPAQWAEQGIRHIPGLSEFKMPLHDWASGFRRRAESTPAGIAGEVGGTIAPFLIPGVDAIAGLRGGAAVSTLARLASAAQRLQEAARATGAASKIGEVASRLPGAERAREAWQGASSGQRAFVKAGAASTALTPKDSEHFGRQALEDFLVGGALGRLGNIGERVSPGGRTIEDLYREGEIPMIYRKKPMGGYRPPKTRPPTERTEKARLDSALKEARRLREQIENPERAPQRASFFRNYPEEMKAGAQQYGRDAARQWEREQSAYQRRRNLPHHLGHLGWHLPFLFGHHLGIPMAARYAGASMLSWLARQWGRELARRGTTGQRLPPHRDYNRILGNISPYGLGLTGANITQQTGADELVGPMLEPDTE